MLKRLAADPAPQQIQGGRPARYLRGVSDILGDLAQGIFAGVLGDWFAVRRRKRLERRGEFEVAARVIDGSQPGLTTSWSHLIASFGPGLVRHRDRRSGAVGQFPVIKVGRSEHRQPQGREAFVDVNPNLRVFRLETGTATLEVGVYYEYVRRVLDLLATAH